MTAAQTLIKEGMQTRELMIVERMLKLHLDIDTIEQATGLLHEEIIKLKEKLGL